MAMKKGAVIFLAGSIFVGGLVGMCTTKISQGQAGVVYSASGGVKGETLSQGWQTVSPFSRVTEYPISTSTVNYKDLAIATKDGKPLTMEITYDYFNDVEKLPHIFNKFKGAKPEAIEDSWLKSRLKESALSVTSKYTILEVFQNRENIRTEIQKRFQDDVKKHGFIVENVTLGNPKADGQTEQALQKVIDRQQELEALEIEKKQAVVKAEKKIEEAKGEAESKRIQSEAEAKANETVKQSLSPEIVNYESIKKWDGKLPSVTGGATPMVTIPQGENK
ncbi:prohibitin family protein [Bacillus bombysepticus]|nr:prohibitin family protein [Bacillus bombysepticus]HDR4373501.1 prohibitin family protein [Bacillus cereus]